MLACVIAASPACDGDEDPPPPVELRGDGARASIGLAPFQIRILDPGGREVLRTLTGGGRDAYGAPAATRDDGADNIRIIPGWDGYVAEERAWAHGSKARTIAKTDTSASFELDAGSGKLVIDVAIEGAKVKLKTTAVAATTAPSDIWNKASLAFALGPDDHFFGLGERFASVDHRGLSLYAWAEEVGTGKGEHTPADEQNPFPNGPSMTGFPVPFFYSTTGYAMHLATTFRTETHFGSERKDAWRVAANTASFEAIVYVHDDPLVSLDEFTRDTGRSMVPASWVFGPRKRVSVEYAVNGVPEWKKLREAHVPMTQLDDAVHLLPARSELGREAELLQWTTNAHAAGYKVIAYNNPYISTSKPSAGEDLAFGKDRKLFALTADGALGETFFISGSAQTLATIDLTKPEAVTWFQDLLRRSLALGYDGWMHDFGEYVRRPWVFSDGRKGDEVHNLFPVLSAKAAHDLLVKERPDNFMFFVRSGYTGTQQYVPAVWSSDPEATFDVTQGLPAMVRAGVNLGMSGVPLWGSDGSGYKCITDFPNDKEIYLRWTQFAAVSPIMQEEDACANPIKDKEKWKLWNDDETVRLYSEMTRLHTRLSPYFDVLAREANRSGQPIMRHPFLYHPHDTEAWKVEGAYYLGPSLWAAPVIERGATTKDTWLPPGKWVELFDHAAYDGGKHVTLPAPLDRLPLLLKDGGIVPMFDPSIETLAPATDPTVVTVETVKDRLDVMVALSPGRDASITLADGTSLVARRAAASAAPSNLPEVAPDALAACEGGCVATTAEAGVDRLRLTTPPKTSYVVTHGDLTLEAHGPVARRIRWDVKRFR